MSWLKFNKHLIKNRIKMFVIPTSSKAMIAMVSSMYMLVAYTSVDASKITCPVISCETTISDFICYQHEAATPVSEI